jgi:hypothetical protein
MFGQTVGATSRETPAKTSFNPSPAGDERLGAHQALTSIVISAALRALPTQLDLFTAVVGGGGVGGIVGGAVAWLLDEDLAQGGILGGVLGMTLGALLAILQSGGLYS